MTKILAHRGASGYAPENTMAAFDLALTQGSHGVETDVHLTKDGKLVLSHDHTLARITARQGEIKDYTLKELRELDWGSWFSPTFKNEKIPELNDLLQLIKDKDVYLNLEIKFGTPYYKDMEELILKEVSAILERGQIIISSFNHYSLQRVKQINPHMPIGFLTSALLIDGGEYVQRNGGAALHPDQHTVTEELVKSCHDRNIGVNTYTVNDTKRAGELIKYGVDSLITNYPDKLLALL